MNLLQISVLFALILTFLTIIVAKIFRKMSRKTLMLLALGFTPALGFAAWIIGIIWINSSFCTDINICDSGGMLALTLDIFVFTVLSFVVSYPVSFCVGWVVKPK
jgi:hypothetical protein